MITPTPESPRDKPTKPSTVKNHLMNVGLNVVIPMIIAFVMHNGYHDPSGYGMVMMGLMFLLFPIAVVAGCLSYVLKHTNFSGFFGGLCLFVSVLASTLLFLH